MNIDIVKLGNVTLNENHIEAFIDIRDMSDTLKKDVQNSIEIAKITYCKKMKNINKKLGTHICTVWSNKPVNIDCTYLYVVLESGRFINSEICTCFSDPENEMMECDCTISVDLTPYSRELKKMIKRSILDKFF